jgi:hypothetical protein
MATALLSRVVRDWFPGLRSRPARSETQEALERAVAGQPGTVGEASTDRRSQQGRVPDDDADDDEDRTG